MNPSLQTALLAGLTLELAGMFAMGFYWLATRHRATPPRARTPPPAARRSAFTPRDVDEWESGAPYPDHILNAVREMERERYGASPLPGTRHEVLHPDLAHNASTDESSVTSSAKASTPTSAPHCPHCQSSRVDTCNRARKTGRTIGSILGATGSVAIALAGAEAGAAAGIVAGPAGSVFGGLAGALAATLFGSAAGSTIGSAVGIAIDNKSLPRYQCRACGHVFSASHQ
ncbi:hypothetical protein [Burkholderia pseudomallei]|uniref:hypothetical protein n=1 Tax=Burkholderia pseudomallei TaxID=28450 RepID=UPI000AD08CC1|nr:hypothetical protein [Burkholderia pseudomallei]